MNKTIFITGASSGLGKQTAILFAQKGWNVIATMRNPANEKELTGMANISLLPLDVTSLQQIEETVKKVVNNGAVDVVFNNAGYGLAGPFEGATDEQLKKQIDTNLMGVMRVTKAFIPHFREKKSGMFITTTSIGGHVTFPFNSVYHATKWAVEGWNESLSYELSPFGIIAKTVAPGGISTDFAGRSLVMTEHPAYKSMVDKALAVFYNPERQKKDYSTAEQIATVVYEAATDGKAQVRYIAGKGARSMYKVRRLFGYKFFMKQVRKMFFS